jgi:hypothetical protein
VPVPATAAVEASTVEPSTVVSAAVVGSAVRSTVPGHDEPVADDLRVAVILVSSTPRHFLTRPNLVHQPRGPGGDEQSDEEKHEEPHVSILAPLRAERK